MPSPYSSRKNLDGYWRHVGRPRSPDETLIIKRLVWQWTHEDRKHRPSLRELARQIGANHSYISRLWRKLLLEGVPHSFYNSPRVTLDDLNEARQRWLCVRDQMGYRNRAGDSAPSIASEHSIYARVPPLGQTPRSEGSPRRGRAGWGEAPTATGHQIYAPVPPLGQTPRSE